MERQSLSIRRIFAFLIFACSSGAWAQNNATGSIVTYSGTDGVNATVFSANLGASDTCNGCHGPAGVYTQYLQNSSVAQANRVAISNAIAYTGTVLQNMPYLGPEQNSTIKNFVSAWSSAGGQPTAAPTFVSSSVGHSNVGKYSATLRANIYENGANATLSFRYAISTLNLIFASSRSSTTQNSFAVTGGGNSAPDTPHPTISALSCGTTH